MDTLVAWRTCGLVQRLEDLAPGTVAESRVTPPRSRRAEAALAVIASRRIGVPARVREPPPSGCWSMRPSPAAFDYEMAMKNLDRNAPMGANDAAIRGHEFMGSLSARAGWSRR